MNNTLPVAAPQVKGQDVATATLVPGKEHGMQGRNLSQQGSVSKDGRGKLLDGETTGSVH